MCAYTHDTNFDTGMRLGLGLGVVSHANREILAVLCIRQCRPRRRRRREIARGKTVSETIYAPAKIGEISSPLPRYINGFIPPWLYLSAHYNIIYGRGSDDDGTRLRKRLSSSTETVLYIILCFFFLSPEARRAQWKAVGVAENGGRTPLLYAAYTESG